MQLCDDQISTVPPQPCFWRYLLRVSHKISWFTTTTNRIDSTRHNIRSSCVVGFESSFFPSLSILPLRSTTVSLSCKDGWNTRRTYSSTYSRPLNSNLVRPRTSRVIPSCGHCAFLRTRFLGCTNPCRSSSRTARTRSR